MAVIVGYILEVTHSNYRIPFFIAGSAYLVALLIIHLLVPRIEPVGYVDAVAAKPFSVGTIVGFGFMGSIFGSFAGWCTGLLSRVSGSDLLKYMALGAVMGVLIGIISGMIITGSGSKART